MESKCKCGCHANEKQLKEAADGERELYKAFCEHCTTPMTTPTQEAWEISLGKWLDENGDSTWQGFGFLFEEELRRFIHLIVVSERAKVIGDMMEWVESDEFYDLLPGDAVDDWMLHKISQKIKNFFKVKSTPPPNTDKV